MDSGLQDDHDHAPEATDKADKADEAAGDEAEAKSGEVTCDDGEKNEFQAEKIRKLENLLTKCKVSYLKNI